MKTHFSDFQQHWASPKCCSIFKISCNTVSIQVSPNAWLEEHKKLTWKFFITDGNPLTVIVISARLLPVLESSWKSLNFFPDFKGLESPWKQTWSLKVFESVSEGPWKCLNLIFTVRRYALHGLSYRNSVCPSVCLSVRLSHSWTVSTWFDLRSWFLHHMVAPSF